MENHKYEIRYTSSFINQFNSILKYFVNKLNNKIAAENFYKKVVREIEKRSESPESYEKYSEIKKRKNAYYRIYVNNYTIFYIVKDNAMELRKIIYSKRDFNNLI